MLKGCHDIHDIWAKWMKQVMTICMYTNNYSIIEIATAINLKVQLEGDLKYVWQKIQKVIDPLHISNHKVFLELIYKVFLFLKSIFEEARMQYFVPPI